jgi:hypothetical protein
MSTPLDTATWRTASYSHPNEACVDIARPGEAIVGIRDSKAPHAGRLTVTPSAFDTFLNRVKS